MNFDDLTENQRNVLGLIAINEDGGHNRTTVRSLMARGLIEGYDEPRGRGFSVRRYRVPIHVHIAWCEWCSARQP